MYGLLLGLKSCMPKSHIETVIGNTIFFSHFYMVNLTLCHHKIKEYIKNVPNTYGFKVTNTIH